MLLKLSDSQNTHCASIHLVTLKQYEKAQKPLLLWKPKFNKYIMQNVHGSLEDEEAQTWNKVSCDVKWAKIF